MAEADPARRPNHIIFGFAMLQAYRVTSNYCLRALASRGLPTGLLTRAGTVPAVVIVGASNSFILAGRTTKSIFNLMARWYRYL